VSWNHIVELATKDVAGITRLWSLKLRSDADTVAWSTTLAQTDSVDRLNST
jgi:hypothetical protein